MAARAPKAPKVLKGLNFFLDTPAGRVDMFWAERGLIETPALER